MSWFIDGGFYSLENIAILSAKWATFRSILWSISRNEGLKKLNNSVLDDKGVLYIYFSPNKKPIEGIKEGVFGVTYFRDIKNGTKLHGKNLIS